MFLDLQSVLLFICWGVGVKSLLDLDKERKFHVGWFPFKNQSSEVVTTCVVPRLQAMRSKKKSRS